MATTTFPTPVDGATSWKKASFTPWYPSATSTSYQDFVVPELAGATEIVALTGTSSGASYEEICLHLFGGRDTISAEYDIKILAVSNDTYNYSLGLKYTKSTTTLGYRQTYMGTNSSYRGIIEVWYR